MKKTWIFRPDLLNLASCERWMGLSISSDWEIFLFNMNNLIYTWIHFQTCSLLNKCPSKHHILHSAASTLASWFKTQFFSLALAWLSNVTLSWIIAFCSGTYTSTAPIPINELQNYRAKLAMVGSWLTSKIPVIHSCVALYSFITSMLLRNSGEDNISSHFIAQKCYI